MDDMRYMDQGSAKKGQPCYINNHDYEGGYIQPGIVPEGEVGSVQNAPASPEFQPDWTYSKSFFLGRKVLTGGGDPNAGKGSM
jgi:hypothetical protein